MRPNHDHAILIFEKVVSRLIGEAGDHADFTVPVQRKKPTLVKNLVSIHREENTSFPLKGQGGIDFQDFFPRALTEIGPPVGAIDQKPPAMKMIKDSSVFGPHTEVMFHPDSVALFDG